MFAINTLYRSIAASFGEGGRGTIFCPDGKRVPTRAKGKIIFLSCVLLFLLLNNLYFKIFK